MNSEVCGGISIKREFFEDKGLHLRTLEGALKNLEFGAVLILRADHKNVGEVRIRALKNEGVLGRRESRLHGPGAVDDGKAHVGERPPEEGAVGFEELKMLRVLGNVVRRCMNARTGLELDDPVALKELQAAYEIGGVGRDLDDHAVLDLGLDLDFE